jgi:hypothetical protein
MSSSQERPAGGSGSTMGYEHEESGQQVQGQMPQQTQASDYQSTGRDYTATDRDYQATGRDYQATGRDYQVRGRHATEHRGAIVGFTALAGTLMLIGGLWMVTVGIVALAHGHTFTTAPAYTFRYDIRGWGWTELALGIVIFAAGMCVFLGMAWARYVGAFLAGLSAIANFAFIPYQPAWSILLLALDAFIIWALLAPRRAPGEF